MNEENLPQPLPMTREKPSLAKRLVTTGLKIAFAVGLIYWLVQKGALDFGSLRAIATLPLISAAVACVFAQIFVNNYRWLTLMRAQGFESSIRRTMPLSLIGMFFNFAMPGGVGGDVIKGYYLLQQLPNQRAQQKIAAALSIFMDRMVGFFVMIATAFFALFLNWSEVSESPQLRSIAFGVTSLFVGFLVFFALSFSTILSRPPLSTLLFEKLPGGSRLKELYQVLHSYRHNPSALCVAVVMSVINQMLMVTFVAMVGNALGLGSEISLPVYFFLVPIGTVVQALPISPAGIGVGQAAFFFLFNLHLHTESPIGPVAVTAMQLTNFFWGLFGAYFYLRRTQVPAHAN